MRAPLLSVLGIVSLCMSVGCSPAPDAGGEPDPWAEAVGTVGEGTDPGKADGTCKSKPGIRDGDYTRLSAGDVANLAHDAGIACGLNLVKAVAVAGGESSRYEFAYHINTNCSIDRGLWQINTIHGSLATYDLVGNAKAMYSISSKGTDWRPWYAYTGGGYKQYWSSACDAVAQLCGQNYC